MMVRDELRDVGELPSVAAQIDREHQLLAAELDAWIETADLKERRPPDDRRAGDEAEDGRPRKVRVRRERAVRHERTDRIVALLGADDDSGRNERQVRKLIEDG